MLDARSGQAHDLTMFKIELPTTKGEQTRQHIYTTALALFREQGFDAATMQDVAERAGVAKSAAYYYFPSKEALIQAYYEAVQTAQERLCEEAFARTTDLKPRLRAAMEAKFDLAQQDRAPARGRLPLHRRARPPAFLPRPRHRGDPPPLHPDLS